MDAVFKKLNFKGQKTIVVLQAPDSFEENLSSVRQEATIVTDIEALEEIEFALIFVTKQEEIDRIIPDIAPKLKGDAVLWMCYPKGTSKKYKCDFNRDTGWAIMGPHELEPVRMVAVDDDWSALRFKKVDFIKTMKRNALGALTEKGKIKAGQK